MVLQSHEGFNQVCKCVSIRWMSFFIWFVTVFGLFLDYAGSAFYFILFLLGYASHFPISFILVFAVCVGVCWACLALDG